MENRQAASTSTAETEKEKRPPEWDCAYGRRIWLSRSDLSVYEK